MKYAKPAIDLEQQIDLLIRRGMTVPHRETALHHLRHINYYRLRAYWLPDEIPAAEAGDHAFRLGTDFEDILDLYSFDRKLRLLVMDAIERIEVSLRTRWAHVLSTRYGSHAYQDPALFRDRRIYLKCFDGLKSELSRSHETFVAHYRKTYTSPEMPPLWVICEVLSFGQLSLWFRNLKRGPDRAEIAAPYGIDEQILESFMHHLAYVRNVCAHHSRLWNREMTIGMKLPRRPSGLHAAFNQVSRRRVYNTLVTLAFMVDVISPGSAWRANLLATIKEHPKTNLEAMGFPIGWRQLSLWLNSDGGGSAL